MTSRDTPSHRLAELFLSAAKDVRTSPDFLAGVDVSVCMCDALYHHAASHREYVDAKALLMEIIGDDAILAGPERYRWGKNLGDTPDEIRRGREVALLFLAAMVKAGSV